MILKHIVFLICLVSIPVCSYSQIESKELTALSQGEAIVFSELYTNDTGAVFANYGTSVFNNALTNKGEILVTSDATTTIYNSFTSDGGILGVSINGDIPGATNGYTQITVNGDLILSNNSTLEAIIDNSYTPIDGTKHTIIVYTGTLTGTFTTVTLPMGWNLDTTTSGEINIVKDSTLQLEDFDSDFVTVYPNPTSSVLNISSKTPVKMVEVYDLSGKKIMTSNNTRITLEQFPDAIYLVQIFDNENGSLMKKIIKRSF